MTPLVMFGLAFAVGQFDGAPGSVGQKLAAEIVRRGYQRVGVLPRFVVRQGGGEALGGSIGPEAELLPEVVQDALVERSQGRFEVVDLRRMAEAFKDLTLADLGRAEALAKAAGRVGGLHALVTGSVLDQRGTAPELKVRCRLVDLRRGSLAASVEESAPLDLATAAYMGESWELRRWTAQGLVNVGLKADRTSPFGAGDVYEVMQYNLIRRDHSHPLLDPGCPYRLAVVVGGQERPLARVGDQVYVALDPADTYEIVVKNGSPRGAYLSLFVDGINVLGKRREHPSGSRYWNLAAGGKYQFRGWTTGGQGEYRQEAFEIVAGDDSVALGQGFGQALGNITAVFSTVGMEGVPPAPPMFAAMELGTFGTGAGASSRVRLQETKGPKPGLILAAITVRYTTSDRLKRLEQPSR